MNLISKYKRIATMSLFLSSKKSKFVYMKSSKGNKIISDQKLKEIMEKTPMVRSAKTEKIMEDLPAFIELINDKSKWRKL